MDLFGESMNRLERVDGYAPDRFNQIENAVLINPITSASSFKAEERQRLLEEDGVRACFEQLFVLLRFAFAELDTGRTLRSGFFRRFVDIVEKLRNFEHKFKILRFFEIRSGSISTRDTLEQGANKPEQQPRSTWNEIAISVANSGFPSVLRRFSYTLIGVD